MIHLEVDHLIEKPKEDISSIEPFDNTVIMSNLIDKEIVDNTLFLYLLSALKQQSKQKEQSTISWSYSNILIETYFKNRRIIITSVKKYKNDILVIVTPYRVVNNDDGSNYFWYDKSIRLLIKQKNKRR